MLVLGRRPQTAGCCETGEFCTDLFLAPGIGAGGALLALLARPEFPGALAPAAANPPSDGDVAMLGVFSLEARSIAEFRRIIIVLVCGNISMRNSFIFC